MQKKIPKTIYFQPKSAESLQKRADSQRRSFSDQAVYEIEKGEENGKRPTKKRT